MITRKWLEMGMPVSVVIADERASEADIDAVEQWLKRVDQRYSTYRADSLVCRFERGELPEAELDAEFAEILDLCTETGRETDGYFDAWRNGHFDPSGLVKGWAIFRAAHLLRERGREHFLVDVGGDVQAGGFNAEGEPWRVGIRNPFNRDEIVKVLAVSDRGVATSGTAIRGEHIYNPLSAEPLGIELVSLTVVGPNIYEADRFATAAFAMGRAGLDFLARRPHLEGYEIDRNGIATLTEGFARYVR